MSLPDLTFYTPSGYTKPVYVSVGGSVKKNAPVSWAEELYSYFNFYVKNTGESAAAIGYK